MRDTKANRHLYGGGIPVDVEPHQFWPANEEQRKALGAPRLSLVCRECGQRGLYGRDGKWRHRK